MTPGRFPFAQAVPGVCELQPYQPGKPVEELERELGVVDAVKLASNENPWGCSPSVKSAICAYSDIGLYPDANGFVLKNTLAGYLGVESSHITLGNGSNDVLDLLARVFVGPGDEVIFSEYAFLVYPLVTRAVGGVAVVTPAKEWGHDLTAMSEAVSDRTRLIFIANPNNPTGTYVSGWDLEKFVDDVPDHIVVVIDEAYFEYVAAKSYPNGLEGFGRYPNLVVTRTFSKIYGLAGLRVGYSVASADITDLLNRVRQPFNVNALAQVAAVAAIGDAAHLQRCARDNAEQLERFAGFCRSRGLGYIPSVANFLSVEFGPRAGKVYQDLLRQGVIVRPLENYNMPEHLRITIGRENEMDKLFDALQSVL
jgi:histidinol-phosphate aminotransferase